MSASCFILCRVVDHYGDAGVCWRLTRQLENEYGLDVTLFIDDLATLQRLAPTLDTTQDRQHVDRVTVQRLTDAPPPPASHASFWPDVIIDAFGGGLPASWLTALKRDFPPLAADAHTSLSPGGRGAGGEEDKPIAPRWIVLEYLSAEPWIETMHGLVSPPPSINIPRHFFFPGFTETTGGLLREKTLLDERNVFCSPQHFPDTRRAFLEKLGVRTLSPNALLVSLFCYDTPALPALLDALAASPSPIVCLIPETVASKAVQQWRNLHSAKASATLAIHSTTKHGSLTLHTIPFLSQTDFDRLLWSCGLNFVRGEDSFVRAQWAANPFIWQAYQQTEQVHLTKVDAFLERYLADAPDDLKTALSDFTYAWNDEQRINHIANFWSSLIKQLPSFEKLACDWEQQQSTQPDLAQRLVDFIGRGEQSEPRQN
ncbi:MAG: elongation factor P maturation arginine rhamnosyltransferase EarP, partial [Burkholderiales bacterium]|nr:elongation factor P maturation arginine rhamnosyltransferase EarP [Burkholderiales bacterium]